MNIKLITINCLSGFLLFAFVACDKQKETITMADLLDEMTDLKRLTEYEGNDYKSVQYSSYDRRSTHVNDSFWFANADGFGNEPIPGFEEILREPDSEGIGEYLICDVQQPGVILRLWTASISGKVRVYIDELNSPIYEGSAQDFFWKTLDVLSGIPGKKDSLSAFRQFDAVYFPIPFAQRCRIEWIGKIEEIHFYHVGVRVYKPSRKVQSFRKADFINYAQEIENANERLLDSPKLSDYDLLNEHVIDVNIPASTTSELFSLKGSLAINVIELKIHTKNYEEALRRNVIKIYFDEAPRPQVNSPLADFFGASPGIYPYQSLPMSISADSIFTCRLIMPFRKSARIEIVNGSNEDVNISGSILTDSYKWKEGKTMYFHSVWSMDYDLTANNDPINKISDILYFEGEGKGRVIGVAAFIYNPSNVPTSWGNWWGEGDEKIFVDKDTFPSFFGTGSEDYFNYSWSSSRIFSYPYCGQPRNDGPGNRGYVSNYRWHISDDIPFNEKISFYMELWHHGVVADFSYGRIVWFYALPGIIVHNAEVSDNEIRPVHSRSWSPEAYKGSSGYKFIQAEKLTSEKPGLITEAGILYANDTILRWKPLKKGDSMSLIYLSKRHIPQTRIGFTLAHSPRSGSVSFKVNGKIVKFDEEDSLNLFEPNNPILANHFSEDIELLKGINEIELISEDEEEGKSIGVDFLWVRMD